MELSIFDFATVRKFVENCKVEFKPGFNYFELEGPFINIEIEFEIADGYPYDLKIEMIEEDGFVSLTDSQDKELKGIIKTYIKDHFN